MPVTASLVSGQLPEGFNGNLQELVDAICDVVTVQLQQAEGETFLTGQVGGTKPTEDVGIWINDGVIYVWDEDAVPPGYRPATTATDYIGDIRMAAHATAPTGYLVCDGTSYLQATYPDLFAVIGTAFGGDATNFNVPDLRGRVPMGSGTGSGLSARTLGTKIGFVEQTLISQLQMPPHKHAIDTNSVGGSAGKNRVRRDLTDVGNSRKSKYTDYAGGMTDEVTPAQLTLTIAAGVITAVVVDEPGADYPATATITVIDPTGGGSGAVLIPTINGDGEITGVAVSNGGTGYDAAETYALVVGTQSALGIVQPSTVVTYFIRAE